MEAGNGGLPLGSASGTPGRLGRILWPDLGFGAISSMQVTAAVASLPGQPHRVRLLVHEEGVARVQVQPLPDTPKQPPVRIGMAPQPIESQTGCLFLITKRPGARRTKSRACGAPSVTTCCCGTSEVRSPKLAWPMSPCD